ADLLPDAAARRERVARVGAADAVAERGRPRTGRTGIRARRVKIAPHAQAADPVAPRARLSPPGRRGPPARSRGDLRRRSGRGRAARGTVRSRLWRALPPQADSPGDARAALDAGDLGRRRAAARSITAARLH